MKNIKIFSVLCAGLLATGVIALGCKRNSLPAPDNGQPTNTTSSSQTAIDSIGSLSFATATVHGNAKPITGASEVGVYWGLTEHPTGNKTSANSYSSGAATYKVELSGLQPNTTYWVRSYLVNGNKTTYSEDRKFTTLSAPNYVGVVTDTMFAAGAYTAFAAGTVKDSLGEGIKETGICISDKVNPVVTGRKVITPGKNDLSIFVRIDSLKEASNYHIRAYSISKFGTVNYGKDVTISTIARGRVTYTMVNQDPNADADTKAAYSRINAAFARAVEYQNNFTSSVKALSVNYSPGTPTADAVNSGWINMGANPGYQQVGTVLHEIEHTLGGGTSWFWPKLIVNGVCVGKHTNQILQFMTRNPNAVLYGDGMHSWPYGFNGNWEDTGKDMDYIIHCLIVQGMKKDGLPDAN
ncbi:hypothetical protein CKK33_15345 [Mucilaginibacter sp. MD40]|uniref:fibronectin type III domain-containing protein n=1 Tax=Mucilaginibacter sp. MD40 TaxID=2029590 RepID=UPI000BACD636|nr:fibronectin type III domain-containing protein [Mucilaginibacter sp. MD40]PAW94794.1 hypothetical protein CKK33_15345 [Mucilaginibacter sp. MD40]